MNGAGGGEPGEGVRNKRKEWDVAARRDKGFY